jgi:hypothetical protein
LRWILNLGHDPRHLELRRLLPAQQRLSATITDLVDVSRAIRSLNFLLQNSANHKDRYTLERQGRRISERIEVLGNVGHPYLVNHPPIAAVLKLPMRSEHEFTHAFHLSQICTEALIPLLVRVMGDLCGLALSVEKDIPPKTTLPLSTLVVLSLCVSFSGAEIPPPSGL